MTSHARPGTDGALEEDGEDPLRHAVDVAAHALPAQGPITVFIHHNTLHAFEELPFEQAVVEGGRLFGCEPFLSADAYRAALESGRIAEGALRFVIKEELGGAAARELFAGQTTAEVLELLLRFEVPAASGRQVRWLLEEGDARRRVRADLPPSTRERILAGAHGGRDGGAERGALEALWSTAQDLVRVVPAAPPSVASPPVRLRDLLAEHARVDIDARVNPLLIRLSAAYTDQGIAQWAMPGSDRSFYAAVAELYGAGMGDLTEPWLRRFGDLLAEDLRTCRDEWASLRASLEALGLPPGRWPGFLRSTALALRGWAGMFRQLELRPDRVPVHAPPASLGAFLAVRLIAERAAAEEVARKTIGTAEPLAALFARLAREWKAPAPQAADERAWQLLQFFQVAGLNPAEAARLEPGNVAKLVAFMRRYDAVEIRRLLHRAYERSFYDHALDTLAAPRASGGAAQPRAQVVCCIDEREESFRRHLEEVNPDIETFGYAGFFGLAMAFRGIDDAHTRPLCPVAIVPKHEIHEVPVGEVARHIELRRRWHRSFARGRHHLIGSGTTFAGGTAVAAVAGTLAAIPLVFRVLLPHREARFRQRTQALMRPRPETTLALQRPETAECGPGELFQGFTTDEMADVVGRVLEEIGLTEAFAPLVIFLGHGSTSLNNPHESAHDCGACGGGRGGPNARAFAAMANNPHVRSTLAARGLAIPDTTWFIGGEHNTCDDAVVLFETASAPPRASAVLAEAECALDEARARNAHERARRFESFSPQKSARLALEHVEMRSHDLAQPRPEYGHATNALCIIGPRERTRGLFLDRRAFLVSYEPEKDPDGAVLARLASAAIPVVAGISLEYYFSTVDPSGYGCGTKLPHNVAGLLGVMDGHASDLRTGLPWQMVEIHEPMRLLVVVDAPPGRVASVFRSDPAVERLVRNRWLKLVSRNPEDGRLYRWVNGAFEEIDLAGSELATATSSRAWYEGRRDHLPFAAIAP